MAALFSLSVSVLKTMFIFFMSVCRRQFILQFTTTGLALGLIFSKKNSISPLLFCLKPLKYYMNINDWKPGLANEKD